MWTHKISWSPHKEYQTTAANVCDFVCPALFVFFHVEVWHGTQADRLFGQMGSRQSTILSLVSSVGSWQPLFIHWNTVYCFLLFWGRLSHISRGSLHDVTLRNSLFDAAVIVQCEEVPITTPVWWTAPLTRLWLLPPQAHQIGLDTRWARQLEAAAPQLSVCCGLHIVYHVSVQCSALCEDDRCFSCLLLLPTYTQTQASPVGRALLNVSGSMKAEATHMHLAGWGGGSNPLPMVFALQMYCIC